MIQLIEYGYIFLSDKLVTILGHLGWKMWELSDTAEFYLCVCVGDEAEGTKLSLADL